MAKPKSSFSAIDQQKEIYINGLSGKQPIIPADFNSLEAQAKERMSPEAYAYIAGGAGRETTMSSNRLDFNRWGIWPRMLRDVSERDISIELFGKKLPTPFLTAPIGVLEMAHKEADIAVAKATSAMDIPMIFSNQASVPMEDCTAVMGAGPRWFQLYWSKSNDLVASLVSRAEACGCDAIVVTLDTTMLGWRIRDLDLAYLPFLQGKGIAQYISDPVFQKLVDEMPDEDPNGLKPPINLNTLGNISALMKRYPGSTVGNFKTKRPLKAVRQFISVYSRPSLTWDDLPFLRKHTSLPILLKGILHPEDAQKAVDVGVDGIIVSNHGGRQVDGSVSAIAALPEVIRAVNNNIPVLLDSGIRGGADTFKAIALGAKAVCIGRPYVYALTLAGMEGVKQLLQYFVADFELTMGLAGCTSISEINSDSLKKG
jgi:lactate 2-monooxygenase